MSKYAVSKQPESELTSSAATTVTSFTTTTTAASDGSVGKTDFRIFQNNESPLLTLDEALTGLSPWSKGYRALYLRVALLTLVATFVGYDGSLMSSINALTSFQEYYGLGSRGASSTGILFAIINVGQITGALLAWMNDWRGRKLAIFIGCVGTCLSAVITATSPTFEGLVAARFFLAVFTTIATTATPMLLVEIAPPQYRATVSGLYNTLYYIGSIIAAVTVYGTFHSSSLAGGLLAWRLPLWLQVVCPGIVCVGIYFVPESPRWLVAQSRNDEALAVLARYHTPNNDAEHPLVRLQMAEITASLAASQVQLDNSTCPSAIHDKTRTKAPSAVSQIKTFFSPRLTYASLFSTPARRHRVALVIAFSWIAQFSGNNVISYYLPILARSVGITSVSTQLLLNVLYAASGWLFAVLGARCHDAFGRRHTFLAALSAMVLFLSLAAAMAATYETASSTSSIATAPETVPNPSPESTRASKAAIAFIFAFGAAFATGFTAMQPVYPAELLLSDQRAQGMALYQVTSGAASFVNTFAAPVALRAVGWWVYVFFVVWDVGEMGVVWGWFVEMKGRTLEGGGLEGRGWTWWSRVRARNRC